MSERPWLLRAGMVLILSALFIASLIIGIIYRRHRPSTPRPQLMVAFLDVGAGDCTLIRAPNGHAILVDAGPSTAGALVAETLQQQGIRSLDLLVLADSAPGSIGGVPSLLDHGVSVDRVWQSPSRDTGEPVRSALYALRRRHVLCQIVHANQSLDVGGARLTALWPPAQGESGRTQAATALICRLEYGATGILLAGPANASTIGYLVADVGAGLECDALQVPAGGADGATTPELLRRASPSVAIISCGATDPPGARTLHRLESAGAALWRTDIQGAITAYADGHGSLTLTAARVTEK